VLLSGLASAFPAKPALPPHDMRSPYDAQHQRHLHLVLPQKSLAPKTGVYPEMTAPAPLVTAGMLPSFPAPAITWQSESLRPTSPMDVLFVIDRRIDSCLCAILVAD